MEECVNGNSILVEFGSPQGYGEYEIDKIVHDLQSNTSDVRVIRADREHIGSESSLYEVVTLWVAENTGAAVINALTTILFDLLLERRRTVAQEQSSRPLYVEVRNKESVNIILFSISADDSFSERNVDDSKRETYAKRPPVQGHRFTETTSIENDSVEMRNRRVMLEAILRNIRSNQKSGYEYLTIDEEVLSGIAADVSLNLVESKSLLLRLLGQGYLQVEQNTCKGTESHILPLAVVFLSEKGLREIGEVE